MWLVSVNWDINGGLSVKCLFQHSSKISIFLLSLAKSTRKNVTIIIVNTISVILINGRFNSPLVFFFGDFLNNLLSINLMALFSVSKRIERKHFPREWHFATRLQRSDDKYTSVEEVAPQARWAV